MDELKSTEEFISRIAQKAQAGDTEAAEALCAATRCAIRNYRNWLGSKVVQAIGTQVHTGPFQGMAFHTFAEGGHNLGWLPRLSP